MLSTRFQAALATLTLALALTAPASSQGNVTPGLDVSLFDIGTPAFRGHAGDWPNGETALSFSTTCCNTGTVDVTWKAPMDEDHPTIGFLVAAERNGRFEQISDRSYVKHGFTVINANGCGNCNTSGQISLLRVGCADTYDISNFNNFYLGPPEEIDPWLGSWAAICSHFDRGEPPVAPPADCDGQRSLTIQMANSLGPLGHRVRVMDAEFEDPANTKLAHQAYYVVAREDETLRDDNFGWREFTSSWSGSSYIFSTTSGFSTGSILNAWTGAFVSSGDAAGFDGHVYVAGKSTPAGALHHYEYALHNRDHMAGVDAIRIPLAPGAVVTGFGVRDIDGNAANDWTASVVGGELVFSGPGNPVAWNTIYNVWFDSDAAPTAGTVVLEQASAFGDMSVSSVPTPTGALRAPGVSYCTAGTSANGCVATLSASGIPSATLSSGFVVTGSTVEGLVNGQFFFGTNGRQANPWGSGTSFQCVVPPVARAGTMTGSGVSGQCDGTFVQDLNARWAAKPTTNPGAGAVVQLQLWYRDPQNTSNQTTSLSDAYEVTVQP